MEIYEAQNIIKTFGEVLEKEAKNMTTNCPFYPLSSLKHRKAIIQDAFILYINFLIDLFLFEEEKKEELINGFCLINHFVEDYKIRHYDIDNEKKEFINLIDEVQDNFQQDLNKIIFFAKNCERERNGYSYLKYDLSKINIEKF